MATEVRLHENWAQVQLTGATHWDAVQSQLQKLRDDGQARAVLLSLERGSTIEAWPAEASDWLALHYPIPVVVSLVGSVTGSAARLAMAADIRIGVEAMTFDARGMGRGPGRARTAVLLAHVRDRRWALRNLTATEALEFGLVSRIVPESALAAAAAGVAEVIASRGPIATKLAKEAVWRGLQMPLEQALRFETDLTLLLQTTKDRAEGVEAFLEKRDSYFTGK